MVKVGFWKDGEWILASCGTQRHKMFHTGLIVGRFQMFHLGHFYMIDRALQLCSEVVLFIGSSQESRTERNPLSYEERKAYIRAVFPSERLIILPLPDAGIGNNAAWGRYVLKNIPDDIGSPDLVISGREERRNDWFADIKINELRLEKVGDLSATHVRNLMKENKEEAWQRRVPWQLHDKYKEIRDKILAAEGNSETASI